MPDARAVERRCVPEAEHALLKFGRALRRLVVLLLLIVPCAAAALDFSPRELNVYFSSGRSPMNFHGHSVFRTIHFEVAGHSAPARRWLRADAGASISYSDIRQARSWFGYRYGDPNDSVRGVTSFFFVRRHWRGAYAEFGSGPMWSNRRVPAATSRFNMDTQIGIGATLFASSRLPLHFGYRFSHISNGGIGSTRNPGLEVQSLLIGMRVFAFRR